MKNPDKLFHKLFMGLALFLTLYHAVWFGADLATNDTKEAIVDGVLAAFWLATLAIFSAMQRMSANLDRELEQSRKDLDKAMGKFVHEIDAFLKQEAEERQNHELIEAIIKDVVGKGKPAKKHCATIAKAIYENTGLYAQVSLNQNGGFDVGLSKQPIEAPKADAKKPAAKKSAATKPAPKSTKKTVKGGK